MAGSGFAQGLANGVTMALNGYQTYTGVKAQQQRMEDEQVSLDAKKLATDRQKDYDQVGREAYQNWLKGAPQSAAPGPDTAAAGSTVPPDQATSYPVSSGDATGQPVTSGDTTPTPSPGAQGVMGGNVAPQFQVQGDPAAFRAQLQRVPNPGERAAALAAFDQQYPQPGVAGPAGGLAPQGPTTAPQPITPPTKPTTTRDPMDGYLVGMTAMQQRALERGDYDRASKLFNESEALRTNLLQKGMAVADSQFAASGGKDYQPYVDLYNRYWNDGRTITNLQQFSDGSGAVSMLDRDGQKRTLQLAPSQFDTYIATLRDPQKQLQAAVENQMFRAKETFKTNEEIRKKAAEQKGEVATKGISVAPNAVHIFPGPSGNPAGGDATQVQNSLDLYQMHTDANGGGYVLNKHTGSVTPIGGGSGTDGWPQGYKPTTINEETNKAAAMVLDLAKNPITGYQETKQGAIATTAARASEVYQEGRGKITPQRAGQQAIDESIRKKIISPIKGDGSAAPASAQVPMALPPGLTGAKAPIPVGSNGVDFIRR